MTGYLNGLSIDTSHLDIELAPSFPIAYGTFVHASLLSVGDEIGPNDIVIGAQINEKSVDRVRGTYGPRFATFKNVQFGEYFSREEWEVATRVNPDKLGMDVLELEALRELRQTVPIFKI